MKTKLLSIIVITTAFASIAMMLSFVGTSFAATAGVPNGNALSGPACQNSDDRNQRFHDRLDSGSPDFNPNNQQGQGQAHDASEHDGRGIEFINCPF